MNIDHRALRPQWTCWVCGTEWPCRQARRLLREAYGDHEVLLARFMAALVIPAASDLGVAPASLYRRFLRWAFKAEECCQVCGEPGHVLVAGLPPRLFPCGKLREFMAALRRGDGGVAAR